MSCYDFYAHLKELPWEVKRRDSHGKAKESCVIKSEWESKFAKRGLGTQVSRISMLSASGIGNTYKFLVCPDTENRNVDISALLSIQVGVGHYLEAVKNEMDLESEFDDAVAFGLIPAADNASALIDVLSGIPYSFVLSFAFTLAKPYLSRDDRAFYVIDNPVKKDIVTGLPYVAATSWKGAFRRAALRAEFEFGDKKWQEDVNGGRAFRRAHRDLFGHEQGAEGKHKDFAEYLDGLTGTDEHAGESRRGRLLFYPSFFQKLGIEVINKRNRETGAGTFPIYFECVPAGEPATFTLVYVPFDLVGKNKLEVRRAVSRDLKTVAATLPELLLTSGVGAKTAEDYGLAEDKLADDGKPGFWGNWPAPGPVAILDEFKPFLNDDGTVKEEYRGESGGCLSNSEFSNRFPGVHRKPFEGFKKWYKANATAAQGAAEGNVRLERSGVEELSAALKDAAESLSGNEGEK